MIHILHLQHFHLQIDKGESTLLNFRLSIKSFSLLLWCCAFAFLLNSCPYNIVLSLLCLPVETVYTELGCHCFHPFLKMISKSVYYFPLYHSLNGDVNYANRFWWYLSTNLPAVISLSMFTKQNSIRVRYFRMLLADSTLKFCDRNPLSISSYLSSNYLRFFFLGQSN